MAPQMVVPRPGVKCREETAAGSPSRCRGPALGRTPARNEAQSSEAGEHHDPGRGLRRDGRDLAGDRKRLPIGDRRLDVGERRSAEAENERRQRISGIFAELEGAVEPLFNPLNRF